MHTIILKGVKRTAFGSQKRVPRFCCLIVSYQALTSSAASMVRNMHDDLSLMHYITHQTPPVRCCRNATRQGTSLYCITSLCCCFFSFFYVVLLLTLGKTWRIMQKTWISLSCFSFSLFICISWSQLLKLAVCALCRSWLLWSSFMFLERRRQ